MSNYDDRLDAALDITEGVGVGAGWSGVLFLAFLVNAFFSGFVVNAVIPFSITEWWISYVFVAFVLMRLTRDFRRNPLG